MLYNIGDNGSPCRKPCDGKIGFVKEFRPMTQIEDAEREFRIQFIRDFGNPNEVRTNLRYDQETRS